MGGGGEAFPYLAYTGQVCAAEHKHLSISQGAQLYQCNSGALARAQPIAMGKKIW